jgi:hypothetical protein
MASCSDSLRALSNESTSSGNRMINENVKESIYICINKPMKIIDGCNSRAAANKARTNFSPSPT